MGSGFYKKSEILNLNHGCFYSGSSSGIICSFPTWQKGIDWNSACKYPGILSPPPLANNHHK